VLVKPLKPNHVMGRVRHWLDAAPGRLAVEAGAAVPDTAAAGERVDAQDAAPPESAEDYFTRLDAAFKSLERPLGVPHLDAADGGVMADSGRAEPVPTLQELLHRLPEETRTILTPAASSDRKPAVRSESPDIEAIASRVLEHFARRDDLLDEIARRVAMRQNPAGR
jgi:hypothetical protein